MKTLVACIAFVVLPGCAVWDAYFMAPYDANEYLLITQIRVDAVQYQRQCGNSLLSATNAVAISNRTELFERYSEQIPRNENGHRASQNLNQIAQGLARAYIDAHSEPSATYCRLKYASIETSATVIQHVVGGRPR